MDDLVVACLAPVDQRPEVDPLTGEVLVNQAMASLSPADSAALEHALNAADTWGLPVLAVAAGGAWVEPVLRDAVSVGADALRVPYPAGHDTLDGPRVCDGVELASDPDRLASELAGAIRSAGNPVLVVCGDRSSLSGAGAVPVLLAHHLEAAQALGLVSISFEPDRSVVVERRLDGGWRERLRLTPPAVCSVEAAGIRLRRAPLERTIGAASARISIARPAIHSTPTAVHAGPPRFYRPRTKVVPPPVGGTRERILSLTGALANREPPRVVGPIEPGAAADELLEFLRRAGVEPTAQD
jgi:electron transfer flavoprotein beta subunit